MDWSTWVYRALSFLVVSCPCALVISIPLSFFAGIGAASKYGILIKGSNYLVCASLLMQAEGAKNAYMKCPKCRNMITIEVERNRRDYEKGNGIFNQIDNARIRPRTFG